MRSKASVNAETADEMLKIIGRISKFHNRFFFAIDEHEYRILVEMQKQLLELSQRRRAMS